MVPQVVGLSQHLDQMAEECELRKPSKEQQEECQKQSEQKKLAQDLLDQELQQAAKLQESQAKLLGERIKQLQLQYEEELQATKLLEQQKEQVLMHEQPLSLSAVKAACAAALESSKAGRGHGPAVGIDCIVTRTPMTPSAGVAGLEGGASSASDCSSSAVVSQPPAGVPLT